MGGWLSTTSLYGRINVPRACQKLEPDLTHLAVQLVSGALRCS